MSLIGILPGGGTQYPGISRLEQLELKVFYPQEPNVVLYTVTDEEFRTGWLPAGNSSKIGIGVRSIESSYDISGQTLDLSTTEDWSHPLIPPGAFIEFRAKIPETWAATKQPSWVQNAQAIGQKLIFEGRVEEVNQIGEVGSGTGISYVCRSAAHFSRFVSIYTSIGGIRLPERAYNVDGTEDAGLYRRSIKRATAKQSSGTYDYAPFGHTGISGSNSTHPTLGSPQNTTANLTMTVGQMIKDMFAAHAVQLKQERVVPDGWDHVSDSGNLPYVQSELDGLDFIPDSIVLGATNFYDAITTIIRRTYPNFGVWVDRSRIWHFTAITDNLRESATTEAEIFDPAAWLTSRLGVVGINLAEPEPGDAQTGRKAGELVYGRLVRSSITNGIADRYTAVRIVGHEITETREESVNQGSLEAAWGQGNASRQTTLQSGYVGSGAQASIHRHYDPGDHNWGIPVYKVQAGGGGSITIFFRGYGSVLWPHTDHEWIGTSCLVAFGGLNQVRGSNWGWFNEAQQFTIIASANTSDIGDGNPGYSVTIDAGSLDIQTFLTELDDSAEVATRIQLSDDLGHGTTINVNQLSAVYREFQITETETLINSAPNNPCNVRFVVNNGALRPTPPEAAIGGRPRNLLEFGQSLGQTSATFAGRRHMRAGGGSFWFGGTLIIPFAALREGKERAQQAQLDAIYSDHCRRGHSIQAPDIKVVYDKTTQKFRQVRVPSDDGGLETFSGTAAIWAGVRRELVIRADRFIDQSQELEFTKLATAVLRTVSDLEPVGDGWEFIETPRFLSLMDLHFRLDVDFYRQFAQGGGSPYGLKQGIVTRIRYDFENDSVSLSLDTKHNPFSGYNPNSLSELLIDAQTVKSLREQQAKAERQRQCAQSAQAAWPVTNAAPIAPFCQSQITRDRGPGRGKPVPPDCHVLGGGLIESSLGILTPAASGSSIGYPAGSYNANANLSEGRGWSVLPFFDSLGRLFFWDTNGSFFRGDQGQISDGVSEQSGLLVDNTFAGWQTSPVVHGDGEATQSLAGTIHGQFGITTETPPPTIYNSIKSYNETTGVITLTYDNLPTGKYTNGMLVVSNGPGPMAPVYIDSHTASTVTLKLPSAGYPAAADFEANSHLYIAAQRKPLPDSSLPEGTRMIKDSEGTWFAIRPDGTFRAVTITNASDYIPNAEDNGAGSPVFSAPRGSLASEGHYATSDADPEGAFKQVEEWDASLGESGARKWGKDYSAGANSGPATWALDSSLANLWRLSLPASGATEFAHLMIEPPTWYAADGSGASDHTFYVAITYYPESTDDPTGRAWTLKTEWKWLQANEKAGGGSSLDAVTLDRHSEDLAQGINAQGELHYAIVGIDAGSSGGHKAAGDNRLLLKLSRDGDNSSDNAGIIGVVSWNILSAVNLKDK